MTENRPKIRFKGSLNDWELTSFSKEAKTRRGLTYKPSNIRHKGIRVLRSSNISEDSFTLSDEDVYVNKDAINIEYVKNGDILITSANGSQKLVGKHCIVKNIEENTTVHGGFMLLASANNPYFLNASMSSSWYTTFIRTFVAGGNGAIGNLNKADLDRYSFLVPSQSEQQKIGEYFRQLDELISAKEQKLAKLRQMKMAMLEKMFPKDGENTPAIRFRGFTEPWEQSSISTIFDLDLPHYSLSRDKLNLEKGDVLNIHYGDILIKFGDIVNVGKDIIPFISSSSSENYKNSKLINGDIIFADTAEDETCGKAIEIQNIENQTVVAGLHTFVARPQITFASKFLGYYFNSNSYHSQLVPLMQGIKVLSISKSTIEQTIVYYPKDLDEQLKIGEFFHNMDTSINSLSEQITKLKDIKQACLSQMFA